MNDNTIIPRTIDAVPLITLAVQGNERLDISTLKVEDSINLSTFMFEPQFMSVELRNKTVSPKPFISIWFNAADGMTSGGRAVEAGEGPNYYKNYGQLKQAIENAINQLV